VKGTRGLVVRPNDVMVYRILADAVEILRVLHVAQRWPPQ
jgi:plasmid stabilization system protein ParE